MSDAAKVDADEPWKAAGAEALDKRTLADWIDKQSASPLCKSALHTMMTADNGVVTQWQSYLANLAMVKGGGLEKYWTESEVYRCRGGNQQLATKLVAAIGAARVLTRTPVRAMAIDRPRRAGHAGLRQGARGRARAAHRAAEVCGTRSRSIRCCPPALAPQMGTNVKYLMALKSPVWRRTELSPELLSDGPVSMTWHATDGQKGAGEALTAFSGGPAADSAASGPPTSATATTSPSSNKVYRGITASFVRARFMDWPSDPWSKASYSFPAPGQVTSQGPTLRQGIGRLHFAGEYASYAFMGYMEGALNSGAAAAKRIAERDGDSEEERGLDPDPPSQLQPDRNGGRSGSDLIRPIWIVRSSLELGFDMAAGRCR